MHETASHLTLHPPLADCKSIGAPWPHPQDAVSGCGRSGFVGAGPGRGGAAEIVGVPLNISATVRAVASNARRLYVGGSFATVNNSRVNSVFTTEGGAPQQLGLGTDGPVDAPCPRTHSLSSTTDARAGGPILITLRTGWRTAFNPPACRSRRLLCTTASWGESSLEAPSPAFIKPPDLFERGIFDATNDTHSTPSFALTCAPRSMQHSRSTQNCFRDVATVRERIKGEWSMVGAERNLTLFRSGVAMWDQIKGEWSMVGGGSLQGVVLAMAVRGSRLFVGGRFAAVGGVEVGTPMRKPTDLTSLGTVMSP